jgi:hypothetical protein
LISTRAYEDVWFDDAEHVSAASLPGMYERRFVLHPQDVRDDGTPLGYVAAKDPQCASG